MTQYILSVTAAAVAVAILRTLAGEGTMGKLVKLLGGLLLSVTVLSPLVHLELPDPALWLEDYLADGEAAARAGEMMGREYSVSIISAEVEAYILDKAAVLGTDVAAEVELNEEGLPASVTLSGTYSAPQKAELSRIIARELGIGEEAQIWID